MPPALPRGSPHPWLGTAPLRRATPAPPRYLGLRLHHKGDVLDADPELAVPVVAGLWGPGKAPGESRAPRLTPLRWGRTRPLSGTESRAPVPLAGHPRGPRRRPAQWVDAPMEVNMPAASGTLLDWKPTGPAGDRGWVTAPGDGACCGDPLTRTRVSHWQESWGHPGKDCWIIPARPMGPPCQGPWDHPAKDHWIIPARPMGPPWQGTLDHPMKVHGITLAKTIASSYQGPWGHPGKDHGTTLAGTIGSAHQGPWDHPSKDHWVIPARPMGPPWQGPLDHPMKVQGITLAMTIGSSHQGPWDHPGKDCSTLQFRDTRPQQEAQLGYEKPQMSPCPRPCPPQLSLCHRHWCQCRGTYTHGPRGSCRCRGRSRGHS